MDGFTDSKVAGSVKIPVLQESCCKNKEIIDAMRNSKCENRAVTLIIVQRKRLKIISTLGLIECIVYYFFICTCE
jgi:hypothetical protein